MYRPYNRFEFSAFFSVGQVVNIRSRKTGDSAYIANGKFMITAIVTWNGGETFVHLGNMSVSLQTLFEEFEFECGGNFHRFGVDEVQNYE